MMQTSPLCQIGSGQLYKLTWATPSRKYAAVGIVRQLTAFKNFFFIIYCLEVIILVTRDELATVETRVNGLCGSWTGVANVQQLPLSAAHFRYFVFCQCCGSGSGIRCLFDPWIRDPGSQGHILRAKRRFFG
jgi:hypothetical protein